MKKENIRAIVTLTLITLIAGVLLGYIFELTKEPIAAQEALAKQEACKSIFAAADSFEPYEGFDTEKANEAVAAHGFTQEYIDEVLIAKDSAGNPLGYVINLHTMEGYGGEIDLSMGITNEGVLNGIEILSIGETAGLGMKADTPEFKAQFAGKNVTQFAYTKAGANKEYEIDALSGATITTNAMVNAVNAGLACFSDVLQQNGTQAENGEGGVTADE
ncbi:MAG: RnfABCDGE type electron transport complex subunit G [Lachnospiraceae bacterium]|nr:RnfABCDGE type electron transport complex subunit G [Lachnospiraceae bacterium]